MTTAAATSKTRHPGPTARHSERIEESPLLPVGWVRKTLGEITAPHVEQCGPKEHGEFTYVDISSIDNKAKRIVDPKILQVGQAPSRAKQNLKAGDVLISMTRPNLNAIALVPPELDGAVGSTGFHVLRSHEVEPLWLFHAVQANDFIDAMCQLVQGALYPAVRPKDIRAYPLPLPPLDEQRRIVAEIEQQFTQLEAGIAALKRVQANLKRYRTAILKAMCEGRLVPTEADLARKEGRTYETGDQLLIRILKRRREVFDVEKSMGSPKKYKEPSEIEPGLLPFIPEGWTLASAEAVCSSVRDGTHDTPAYVSDGLPLITSKNLLPSGLDFDNVKFVSRTDYDEIAKRSGVERGDILFAMIGTIGNPVVVETDREFSIKNVGLFKANIDFILPRYLRYWFMSPTFTRWLDPKQKGTTQKFVPLGLLRALAVALPPFAEQERIVAEVERRLSVVEEQEAVVSANLQRAARLRQSILQRAFSGGLVYNGT